MREGELRVDSQLNIDYIIFHEEKTIPIVTH
jgi:hypothetical protein